MYICVYINMCIYIHVYTLLTLITPALNDVIFRDMVLKGSALYVGL